MIMIQGEVRGRALKAKRLNLNESLNEKNIELNNDSVILDDNVIYYIKIYNR